MSAPSLDDYIKKVEASGARILGRIIWFSITGMVDRSSGTRTVQPVKVTHEELVKWFDDLGLEEKYLPAQIRRIHAFRTACSQSRCVYDLPKDGQSAELLIREVDHNNEFRVHHVIREIKDRKGQSLAYDHIATLRFWRAPKGKPDSTAHYRATILRDISKLDRHYVTEMLDEFKLKYEDLSNNLHSQAIRGMLRDYFASLNAIAVRPSGGIYFVHSTKQETVDALAQLVKRMGINCTFVQVPLPDTSEDREMLNEASQDEIEDDTRILLGEIAEYNERITKKGEKVSPIKWGEFRDRYDVITGRSEEHTKLLGLAQERSAAALEVALGTIEDLSRQLMKGTA